jgi:hypothetical protein
MEARNGGKEADQKLKQGQERLETEKVGLNISESLMAVLISSPKSSKPTNSCKS